MRLVRVLACAAGLWSVAASAQSIDPTRARATIGDPLDLEVMVRTTPELGAARLDRSCVQAQVADGQRLIDDDSLAIDIGPVGDSGLNRLRIRHAFPVVEPVIQARISLTCGANYTREFTVLPQASDHAYTATSSTKARRPRSRPPIDTAKLPPLVRATPPGPYASSPSGPAEVKSAKTETSTDGTAATELHAGGGDVGALARSVLRLFQAAGVDLQRSSQGLLDLRQPDPAASLAAADSKYLMQEVQRLRGESQQSATAIASLHARVERAESDRWLHATWAVMAAIAGLITLVIAVRVAELAAPALLRRFSHRTGDVLRSGNIQMKQGTSIEQYLKDIEARPATTPEERVMAPPAPGPAQTATETIALAFDETDQDTPARTPITRIQARPGGTPNQATTQANRWSHAEFGPPSLDHRRVRQHRDDIDKAILDGYLGFALVMLEQLLHSGEGKHPWVLLRLLDVYRQLRQQDNHERVCAEIEALYSVTVPGYDAAPVDVDSCKTLEQLEEWPALRAAWSSDDASLVLASCLLRGNRQVDRDQATFADLLFLHELAEIRETPSELHPLLA